MLVKDSFLFQSPAFRIRSSVTIIVAFASLIYEFVLAQILSSLVGGAIIQYSLTIACYTFCLGIGAYLYGLVEQRVPKDKIFFIVEILLCSFAIILPSAALITHGLIPFTEVRADIFIGYISIVIIGLLSGMELPYLMQVNAKKHIVLGVDYLGMFIAAISFPFIFLPKVGVIPTAFIVAGANLCSAFCVIRSRTWQITGIIIGLALITLTVIYQNELNSLSSFFFLRKFNG